MNPDAGKWKTTCAPFPGGDYPEYCLHETGGSKKKTLVYLHGLADSAQTMIKSIYPHDGILALVKDLGYSHILVISYGKSWMLKPYAVGKKSIPDFIGLMAKVAEKHPLPKPFVAMGISMGGANALTLALQEPDLFEKVVILNPMLVDEAGYGGKWAGMIVDSHFSLDEWKRANPFSQANEKSIATPIFMTACPDDGFGLWPKTAAWADQFQTKFKIRFMPAGAGCEHSSPSLAGVKEFLQ